LAAPLLSIPMRIGMPRHREEVQPLLLLMLRDGAKKRSYQTLPSTQLLLPFVVAGKGTASGYLDGGALTLG
jgi:hypothetical protein